MTPIKNFFKLIISPQKGWERISQEKITIEQLSSTLLYPILGLFAIIVFLLEIEFTSLRSESGIEKAIQYAVIGFIQFFGAYYLISYISRKLYKQYDTYKCNTYIIYLTSITVLFYILMIIFSSYINYIAPLSLYIIYIGWTGYKYINSESSKTDSIFVITMSIMTIMVPIIISLILRTLLTLIQ